VKTVNAKQAALAKARARRVALDAERDARDRRVEDAAAEAMLLIAERTRAQEVLTGINAALGGALRRVQAEGVGADGTAVLVDLDASEVRRLTKPAVMTDGSQDEVANRQQIGTPSTPTPVKA
jgi:hypothetical protein